MKAFFEGIEYLFVEVIFKYTMDPFRFMENWWFSNIVNWGIAVIGTIAFVYWMLELNKYAATGKEDKSISSHSYL